MGTSLFQPYRDTQFNDFTKHSDDAVFNLTGVKMRTKQDLEILKLLERGNRGDIHRKIVKKFEKPSETLPEDAKKKNCRNFNKKREKGIPDEIGDIVAIQRTQFGTGLKLRPKFFGP
ncbi:hypothetical protein TNCV_4179851 [Trichonephila clavipes]|nr:hypothetical protein TNCV_4179851 [Trichonephila clavipes]